MFYLYTANDSFHSFYFTGEKQKGDLLSLNDHYILIHLLFSPFLLPFSVHALHQQAIILNRQKPVIPTLPSVSTHRFYLHVFNCSTFFHIHSLDIKIKPPKNMLYTSPHTDPKLSTYRYRPSRNRCLLQIFQLLSLCYC
jgi:hypothetical protein